MDGGLKGEMIALEELGYKKEGQNHIHTYMHVNISLYTQKLDFQQRCTKQCFFFFFKHPCYTWFLVVYLGQIVTWVSWG
jgi:hypothetical protein